MALPIEGAFRQGFGASGLPYAIPEQLQGRQNLGFMFLPNYRAWVIEVSLFVCIATWVGIEKTKLGAFVVFAVVVIGGMGSIAGAIVSGFALGLAVGLTKVFYPQASSTAIFLIMALVLLVKPAGLFGRPA